MYTHQNEQISKLNTHLHSRISVFLIHNRLYENARYTHVHKVSVIFICKHNRELLLIMCKHSSQSCSHS